jgi:hypothetical protein
MFEVLIKALQSEPAGLGGMRINVNRPGKMKWVLGFKT